MNHPDVERVLVREAVLELASPRLFAAVSECAETMTLADIAGFIEGDAEGASRVGAGPREAIAEVLRKRFPRGEVDHIADMVAIREPGLLPCVFVIRLAGGAIDVSTVALHMPGEGPRDG